MNYNFRTTTSLIKLPDGLTELMSDMCREVLRYQPDNICEFLANYLSALLLARDKLQASAQAKQCIHDGYRQTVIVALRKYGIDKKSIGKIDQIIGVELKKLRVVKRDCSNQQRMIDLNTTNILHGIIHECNLDNSPTQIDAIHAILTDSLKLSDQKEMTRKIMDYGYRWINETVERTFDFHRKRQRTFNANRRENAAVRIQHAYRQYRCRIGSTADRDAAANAAARFNEIELSDGGRNGRDLNGAARIIQTAYRNHRRRSSNNYHQHGMDSGNDITPGLMEMKCDDNSERAAAAKAAVTVLHTNGRHENNEIVSQLNRILDNNGSNCGYSNDNTASSTSTNRHNRQKDNTTVPNDWGRVVATNMAASIIQIAYLKYRTRRKEENS